MSGEAAASGQRRSKIQARQEENDESAGPAIVVGRCQKAMNEKAERPLRDVIKANQVVRGGGEAAVRDDDDGGSED